MESNKIFGALLLAGVLAMISIIGSGMLVQPVLLKKQAYPIEGVGEIVESGGAPKPAVIEPISGLLAKADADHGEQVSRQCETCHTFNKGGANGTGPNNYGVVGAQHAHVAGFPYSTAMKNFPGVWDYDTLNKFLYNPQKFLPGTKMNFVGIRNTKDRADIVAWLRTQSDNPLPLPPPEEAAPAAAAPAAAAPAAPSPTK